MNSIAPKSLSLASDKYVYRSRVGANLMDVRDAMTELKSVLIGSRVSAVDISCVEIVVAEILNNVVKHAQKDLEQGWFEIQCSLVPSGLHFVCRDNGAPMPGGTPPGGTLPNIERPKDELPEGGWGWSLVRTLSSNLSYVRVKDINLVSFHLPTTVSDPRR